MNNWLRVFKLQRLNMNVEGERLKEQRKVMRSLFSPQVAYNLLRGRELDERTNKHLYLLQKVASSDVHYNRYLNRHTAK